jgi:hypothetical protein
VTEQNIRSRTSPSAQRKCCHRHVRKAPSSTLSPVQLQDVPGSGGMNRWVGVLASLVTCPFQTRSRDLGTCYPPACRAGRYRQPSGGLWILMWLIEA